ncbi:hypothetical protein [Eikenella sp. Marseille-P7795]|uniref:hypothetical protein n=1 Tax=Eikenella sp. Marseille-P7795 TaxID=2866577 RepID=UPI001CE4194C|nr:hypothetical protein [Eikenella sp. Marseille-P7795]
MANIQYSKKLRRAITRLHQLNQRISEAMQAKPDEIISTPFDGSGITLPHHHHAAQANTTQAANPASPAPLQAVALPKDNAASPTGGALPRSQSAQQSEYEQRLPIRYEQVKRFAARRQLEVLELQARALHQSAYLLIQGAYAGVRRTTIVSDSFLDPHYFAAWLEKQTQLTTELGKLLEGIKHGA